MEDDYAQAIPDADYRFDYDESDFADDDSSEMESGNGNGLSPFTLSQIFEHCLEPTVRDGLKHIGKVVVWCVVFRCLTQAKEGGGGRTFVHACSCAIGILVLAHFFHLNTLYLLALAAVAYVVLAVAHGAVGARRGVAMALTCVFFNLTSELFLAAPHEWHQVRGAQMIITMKIISLGFDMDADAAGSCEEKTPPDRHPEEEKKKPKQQLRFRGSGRTNKFPPPPREEEEKEQASPPEDGEEATRRKTELAVMPPVLQYFGYLLCPGTCVFGPWVKYSDYLAIFDRPRWNLTWFIKIVFTLTFSFMFLTISTCWNPWLIPDDNWRWWIAYRDAMSFRASHYFVSYVGEAAAVASGFGSVDDGWNGIPITHPHNVEVPRSLVDVVVSWNIPMHRWLKTYCFKTTLRRFGGGSSIPAVAVTYAASTLLHGANFQLGAVLLSLGFYTYTEHTFRGKLAEIFDASVAAKPSAVRRHKEGQVVVILVNMAFGLLVCFHLAYLGVMFDDQQQIMAEGYSWRHTLSKWADLGFASHWVVLATFLLSLLI